MSDASTWSFAVDYRFQLRFVRHAFAPDQTALLELMPGPGDGRPARALVVVDAGVAAAQPDLVRRITSWFSLHQASGVALAAGVEVVAGGESAKASMGLVMHLAQRCSDVHLCRHSYLIIIGGGALLDAAGLAGALVHRGVRVIRLPSTTLAQCDAGLGVKTAINAFGQKNFLGCFAPPWAVVDDLSLLDAQDARSWRAGISEAVKVAIIKDAPFLRRIAALAPRLAARDADALEEVVRRCAQLHLEHITTAGDPFEQGSSRPLDFGHWTAHRLEILSRHELQHGEAVAIGVALDTCYARHAGLIDPIDADLVLEALATVGFRLWHPALDLRDADGRRSVMGGLDDFREHLGGRLAIAMPAGLGARQDLDRLDPALLDAAWTTLRRYRQQQTATV